MQTLVFTAARTGVAKESFRSVPRGLGESQVQWPSTSAVRFSGARGRRYGIVRVSTAHSSHAYSPRSATVSRPNLADKGISEAPVDSSVLELSPALAVRVDASETGRIGS